MKRKIMLGLLLALVAALLPIYKVGWGPIKAYAYHSGSESDLAANPEMSAVRNFAEISLVPVESRGLLADTARWAEIGKFYTDQALVVDADTVRWVAIGKHYSDLLLAALPYTDVSKFYVERMRSQAAERSKLAANPELLVARSFGLAAGLGQDLLANPELLSLGKFDSCGC
jgi:hypothetical protein